MLAGKQGAREMKFHLHFRLEPSQAGVEPYCFSDSDIDLPSWDAVREFAKRNADLEKMKAHSVLIENESADQREIWTRCADGWDRSNA
jgi:hypothetical protein